MSAASPSPPAAPSVSAALSVPAVAPPAASGDILSAAISSGAGVCFCGSLLTSENAALCRITPSCARLRPCPPPSAVVADHTAILAALGFLLFVRQRNR
ncbi:MAG: hypothetical protein LBT53_00165 [Puniceicoccales bacterium]|nr:hypothetical protein [Puniceicoccales bacterium]